MSNSNTKQKFRNAPLIALTAIVSIALEAFGWGYIFLTNKATSDILGFSIPLALVEAVIISATGILALIAAFVAAERRQDARPIERRKAMGAQILAVILLVPPIVKAAESFAYPAQVDAAHAYRASDQYDAELAASRDPTLDSVARRQALANLQRAVVPARAQFDIGAWLWAGFIYGANMLAATLLWRAKPESPAERDRRVKAMQRERARRQRDARKLAELEALAVANKQANMPSWFRGLFKNAA